MKKVYHLPPSVLNTHNSVNVQQVNDAWYMQAEEVIISPESLTVLNEQLKDKASEFLQTSDYRVSVTVEKDRIVLSGLRLIPNSRVDKITEFLTREEEYNQQRDKALREVAGLLADYPEILEPHYKYKLQHARDKAHENKLLAATLNMFSRKK